MKNKVLNVIRSHRLLSASCLVMVMALVIAIVPNIHFNWQKPGHDSGNLLQQTMAKIVGGVPTITVGGNTAYAAGTPDYTCDGTDDNVQWQAALNALPASGGRLVGLTFDFMFSATVSRAINNVTIECAGISSNFVYNGAAAIFSAGAQSGWVFRDFKTDAGGIAVAGASNYTIENVYVGAAYLVNVYPQGVKSTNITDSAVTSGKVITATTGGLLQGSTFSTFDQYVVASDAPAETLAYANLLIASGATNISICTGVSSLNATIANGTTTVTSPGTWSAGTSKTVNGGAGNLIVTLAAGQTGYAFSGGVAITGSPVALVAGDNTITVAGNGTIYITGMGDEQTINAAITAANGKSVKLLGGTFYLYSPILVNAAGTRIYGEGNGTILYHPNYTTIPTFKGFINVGASNVEIDHLYFSGNYSNQVNAPDPNDWDVICTDTTKTNISVHDCTSYNSYGLSCLQGNYHKVYQNVLLSHIDVGISFANGNWCSAIGNHIYGLNSNGDTGWGIQFDAMGMSTATGNIITRVRQGILESEGTSNNNTVVGNLIYTVGDNGIYTVGAGTVVTGNNIRPNASKPSVCAGTYQTWTGNAFVSGNLTVSGTNNTISANTFQDSAVITNSGGISNIIKDNIGYIASGEIRSKTVSLVPTGTCTATTVTGTFTESPASLKPGVNTLHCTADGTISVVIPTGSSAVAASVGGGATVTDSPKSCPTGTTVVTVTAGGTNEFTITVTSIVLSWHNPETQDIYIQKVVIGETTAGGTATAVIDVGIADDAVFTNGGVEFFDDANANSAAVYDSWVPGDTGQQTKWVLCQDSASATDGWVVGKLDTEIADSLAGTVYIEYCGK